MLTRRILIAAACGLPAVGLGAGVARADASSTAENFIRQTAARLMTIVNGPASDAEKRQQLQGIVDSAVDVPGVARFCLGRFWRLASPEQQQEYVRLFHDVLLNSITGKLGQYRGVKISVGQAHPGQGGIVVASTVLRPNNAPNQVDWVVGTSSGAPKIEDVIAEGTSLRLTQRSDYASYLERNNNSVAALIAALRKQVSS